MTDSKVCVVLRGDEECWDTTLLLSEDDALLAFNLLNATGRSGCVDLPSVGGRAELENGCLRLVYRNKAVERLLSVQAAIARGVLAQAIEVAAEALLDSKANEFVWDWVNERFDARVLTLKSGERVEATLLLARRCYFAVQNADASVWVADVSAVRGNPQEGQRVVLEQGLKGMTVVARIR